MWETANQLIQTAVTTAINLAELGIAFGVAALFFKGINWIIDKAKALTD